MIDLIANGFALRKPKQVLDNLNLQIIRNKSARDNPHEGNTPAQSAYSARSIGDLIDRRSSNVADYADYAENQSNTEYQPADLLRDTCGLEDPNLWGNKTSKSSMLMQCDHCIHFTPDTIGSGAGIGDCAAGVKWTLQVGGRMPLYRYAERHCVEYK